MTTTEYELATAVMMLWEAEAGGECEHGVGHERDCPAGDACPLNPLRPAIRAAYAITAPDRSPWRDVEVSDGMRVRLARTVERFPHFQAAAGLTGTVTDITDGNISVRMDEHLAGAETWDNEIVWAEDDRALFCDDVVPLTAADLRVIRMPDGDDYVAEVLRFGAGGVVAFVRPDPRFIGGAQGDPEPEQLECRWIPATAITDEEVTL